MTDLSAMSLEQLREHLISTGLVQRLLELARDEDLGPDRVDRTSMVCVGEASAVEAKIVARGAGGGGGAGNGAGNGAGVAAGLAFVGKVLDVFAPAVLFHPLVEDGERFEGGQTLGTLSGSRRQILGAERTILNLLGRMCGIATRTARFVEAMEAGGGGGGLRSMPLLLDTRKTTPGLRVFEKYAVRCGGGHCHRMGLHDAVLIKDNHLEGMGTSALRPDAGRLEREGTQEAQAQARAPGTSNPKTDIEPNTNPGQVADAVALAARLARACDPPPAFVEVEADTLDQARSFLAIEPGLIDIVLLDNMPLDVLREAIALRDAMNRAVLLEASGGITLETIGAIAATGVDRISCGSLTHGAVWIDLGLDIGEDISENTCSDTGAKNTRAVASPRRSDGNNKGNNKGDIGGGNGVDNAADGSASVESEG